MPDGRAHTDEPRHRFIDPVMLHSQRLDEQARLMARLTETIAPVVDDLLPPGDQRRRLVTRTILRGLAGSRSTPLDVMATALDHLAIAIDTDHLPLIPATSLGAALVVGLCDGHRVHPDDVASLLAVTPEEVAAARDAGRAALDLPPATPTCLRRCPTRTPDANPCAACLLAAADQTAARGRLVGADLIPTGHVTTTLLQHARKLTPSWVGQPRPRFEEGVGPETWIEEITAAVAAAHGDDD